MTGTSNSDLFGFKKFYDDFVQKIFFFHLFVALSTICNFTKNLIFLSPELRYTFSFLGTLPFGWSFLGLTYLSYFFCDQIAHCQHPKTSLPLECFKEKIQEQNFQNPFLCHLITALEEEEKR